MSDNIRKTTILKTKIAKNAQKLPKFNILKNDPNVAQWGTSLANTTKRFGDSTMYSYWDMDRTNTNFKSGFLAKTSKI